MGVCDSCPMGNVRTVGCRGPRDCKIVLVGEAPGAQEIRQGVPFCLSDDTLVLMADLWWKRLGDIKIGDQILAPDEHSGVGWGASGRQSRKWRVATVTSVYHRVADCLRIVTPEGSLVGTGDHRVLTGLTHHHRTRWQTISALQDGASRGSKRTGRTSNLAFVFSPWTREDDYTSGYLSGIFDGEGHVHNRQQHGMSVGFAQNPGLVLDNTKIFLTRKGFQFGNDSSKKILNKKIQLRGGIAEQLRFLGSIRPERLIANFIKQIAERPRKVEWKPSKVLSRREVVPSVDVVDIQTTTGTFIANGFIVHNCGPSGKLLDKALRAAGVETGSSEFFVTNAVRCIPTKEKLTEACKACHGLLDAELKEHPRTVLILLGNSAIRSVTNNYAAHITAARGKVLDTPYGIAIPTFHPAFMLRQPGQYKTFLEDIRYAVSVANGGEVKTPGSVEFVVAREDNIDDLILHLKGYPRIAADIETSERNPRRDRILCIGLCGEKNNVIIVPGPLVPRLEPLFKSESKFIWHNGKFDTAFLRQIGLPAVIHYDTMLESYALNEAGEHGLKPLAAQILGAPNWAAELKKWLDKENPSWADIPEDKLYLYLAQDADNTFQLHEVFTERLNEPTEAGPKWAYEHILIPAANFLREVERHGAYVDVERVEALRTELTETTGVMREEMRKFVALPNFNPDSWKQVLAILKKLGMRVSKTDKVTIEPYAKRYPFVQTLLDYRADKKQLGTYVEGVLKRMDDDHRVHSTFTLHVAVNGRLSSKDPNMQNMPAGPKGKRIKRIFGTPPGRAVAEWDYSQCVAKDSWVGNQRIQDHPRAIFKGRSESLAIVTSRGYSVKCTPNHRILTNNGWKEARNLSSNDWIALEGESAKSGPVDPYWWTVGFWVGDGSLCNSGYGISFAKGPMEDHEETHQLLAEFFEVEPAAYETSYMIHNSEAGRAFRDCVKVLFDKKDLRIPFDRVGNLASFFRGLFDADGTTDKNGVAVSTKYHAFAEDIQYGLLRFGIMSTITSSVGGFNFLPGGRRIYSVRISDSISVSNYAKYIGFNLVRKSKRLYSKALREKRDQGNYVPIPYGEILSIVGKSGYRKYGLNHLHGRPYTRTRLSGLELPTWTRYQWDRVRLLESSPSVAVYDILDQPESQFSANGVICHNCELRCLAVLSGDTWLKQVYIDGRDLHTEVSIELFGKDYTSEQRRLVKTLNFGIPYGRQAPAIAKVFKMSVEEAQERIDAWFARMPQAHAYLMDCRAAVTKRGWVRSAFGRRRRFPMVTFETLNELQNEASNHGISSTASDLTLTSAISVESYLERLEAFIFNLVHDSIMAECPIEKIIEICRYVKQVMEEMPMKSLKTDVPFKADVKIGHHWGDAVHLDLDREDGPPDYEDQNDPAYSIAGALEMIRDWNSSGNAAATINSDRYLLA